jgi:hypothetical protein
MVAEIKRDLINLTCKGIMSNVSPDIIPEGYFPFLGNVRIFREGIIQSRPSIDITGNLNPFTLDLVHSIKKLKDKSVDLTSYIIGAGTGLYAGALAAPNLIESGFNGKRLHIVEYRPENSVDAYLYLTEGSKFRSVGVDNVSNHVGIDPPKIPVSVEIDKPLRKIIDEIGNATFASWVNGGIAGITSNVNRVNTTILAILLDGAAPNFCSIIPNSIVNIQEGCILNLGGTEDIFVEEVKKSTIASGVCTIASVKYVVGATGKCTIDLSTPIEDIVVGSILYINASEYVKVQEVITGSNGTMSIVVTSVGAFAVGNSIEGANSFRTYITLNHIAGEAIQTDSLQSSIGASGIGTLTKTANFDFTNVNNRALTSDDYLHTSILVTDISQIEEVQIQLDIDASTNDFLHNWYFYVLRPDDLLPAAELTTNTLAVQQQVINRRDLGRLYNEMPLRNRIPIGDMDLYDRFADFGDIFIPNVDGQLPLGNAQWAEILIPLKSFQKSGSDESRGLKDVKAIRFSIKTKGATDIRLDSIWVGGGYDLSSVDDSGIINPYRYIARYRESKTKRVSNWSPIPRIGSFNKRTRNLLSIPISPDSRVDKVDFARKGGSVTDFRILGTKDNDATKFVDSISDFSLFDNPKAFRFTTPDSIGESDFYKPFAILDKPKKGTCNVVGNKLVVIGGDNLNISYPPMTKIIVNNILTRFYLSPTSNTEVELLDNLGTLNNVKFEIQEPLLTGQALPIIIGPFGLGYTGLMILGAGDKNAAGTVYWLDGNSPDTMSDLNKLEITPSSEPIIGGVMYDGLPYFWTTRRAWQLIPQVSENGILTFVAKEIANSVGLASRDLICASDGNYIYYLRRDLTGIDRVQGIGNPQSITNDFISNIFINSGKKNEAYKVTNIAFMTPPDFDLLNEQFLTIAGGYLYYRYKNIFGTINIAVYEIASNRWVSIDTYPSDIVGSIHGLDNENDYRILLGQRGTIATYVDTPTIFDTNAEVRFVLPTRRQGDIRLIKEYKEIVIDFESGNTTLFPNNNFSFEEVYKDGTLALNNNVNVINNSGRQLSIIDIQGGIGRESRDILTSFYWTSGKILKFYNVDLSYVIKQAETKRRRNELIYGDNFENKFIQGVKILANTNGLEKVLDIYDEFNIKQDTITIKHDREMVIAYAFSKPFISHAIQIIPIDDVLFQEYEYILIYDKEPEAGKIWEGQENNYGTPNIKQAKKVHIDYRSNNIVILKLSLDNGIYDEYELPNTNNKRVEYIQFLKPKKFKHLKPRLESDANFQLYRNGCKIFITDLTLPSDYIIKNPFGDDSNVTDVRI